MFLWIHDPIGSLCLQDQEMGGADAGGADTVDRC